MIGRLSGMSKALTGKIAVVTKATPTTGSTTKSATKIWPRLVSTKSSAALSAKAVEATAPTSKAVEAAAPAAKSVEAATAAAKTTRIRGLGNHRNETEY